MGFCTKCGRQRTGAGRFCTGCGARFGDALDATPLVSQSATGPEGAGQTTVEPVPIPPEPAPIPPTTTEPAPIPPTTTEPAIPATTIEPAIPATTIEPTIPPTTVEPVLPADQQHGWAAAPPSPAPAAEQPAGLAGPGSGETGAGLWAAFPGQPAQEEPPAAELTRWDTSWHKPGPDPDQPAPAPAVTPQTPPTGTPPAGTTSPGTLPAGPPGYGPAGYGPAGYGQDAYGPPSYGQDAYGPGSPGQAGYDYGPPSYAQGSPGQAPAGPEPYRQDTDRQGPSFGQAPYGQPPYQPPFVPGGIDTPPRRRRHAALLITAVIVLLLAVGGGAYVLVSRYALHKTTAQPAGSATRSAPAKPTPAAVTTPPTSASAASTGSPTASPTVSPSPAVSVAPGVTANPAEPAVAAFLARYFTAINNHDYAAYRSLLDPQKQRGLTQANFDSGYGTTRDSGETLTSITNTGGGGEAATVAFTSHQDPANSATNSACTSWSITLYLDPNGNSYLIGSAPASYHAQYQAC